MSTLRNALLVSLLVVSTPLAHAQSDGDEVDCNNRITSVVTGADITISSVRNFISDQSRYCFAGEKTSVILVSGAANGDGGAALAFFDEIDASPYKKYMVFRATGIMSITALTVYLAGDRREITPHTLIQFTDLFATEENVADPTDPTPLRLSEAFDAAILDAYVEVIVKQTKMTSKDVREMIAKNTIVTAKEAITYGIAHKLAQ